MIAIRFGGWRWVVGVLAAGAALTLLAGCRSGGPMESGKAVRVIFDTDIGTDVDDAGALAILHVMADRGEAKILATISANRCGVLQASRKGVHAADVGKKQVYWRRQFRCEGAS